MATQKKQKCAVSSQHNPAITIRTLTEEDTPEVIKLMRQVFKKAAIDACIENRMGGTPWHKTKNALVKKQIAENTAGCFVALMDDQIVGFISTAVNTVASRGWIIDLAVSNVCQGHGIGGKLIKKALQYFRKLKLHHAKIETLDTNVVGEHLYTKLGFVEVARQIHFAMPLQKE